MAFPDTGRPIQPANTGSEPEPPGATKSAEDNRTQNPRQRGPNGCRGVIPCTRNSIKCGKASLITTAWLEDNPKY